MVIVHQVVTDGCGARRCRRGVVLLQRRRWLGIQQRGESSLFLGRRRLRRSRARRPRVKIDQVSRGLAVEAGRMSNNWRVWRPDERVKVRRGRPKVGIRPGALARQNGCYGEDGLGKLLRIV